MWLNKDPNHSEHEYIIIETRDRVDSKSRLFILDRMAHKVGVLPDPPQEERNSTISGIVQQILGKFPWLLYLISPSRSVTPDPSLESLEEGTQRPISISTSSFTDAHLSVPDSDTISLSATKVARALSDSMDKGSDRAAYDRLQGESMVFGRRYAYGQNAQWIKPKELSLFELVILAETVHRFAPKYSRLEKNCFWFGNIIFDAIIEIFHLDDSESPGDGERERKFMQLDSDQNLPGPRISGRWKGIKVSDTNHEDLSEIARKFRAAYKNAMNEVKIVF
jgi:hypothetical protein